MLPQSTFVAKWFYEEDKTYSQGDEKWTGYLLNEINKTSPGQNKNKMESIVTQLRSLLGAATDGSHWEDTEGREECENREGNARKRVTSLPWGVQEQSVRVQQRDQVNFYFDKGICP